MIGRHYGARRWDADAPSRAAFRRVMASPNGVSVWRWAHPADPPHAWWVVCVMGEDPRAVADHLAQMNDGVDYHVEPGMVEALRQRRALTGVRHAGQTVVREGISERMDSTGQLHPYRPPARPKRKDT